MDIDEILLSMNSRDPLRSWKAAWEIIRTTDRSRLDELSGHVNEFTESLKKTPSSTGLRDSRLDVQLAIALLVHHQAGQCRCTLYRGSDRFDPEAEQKLGFVQLVSTRTDHELHDETYEVRCVACGTTYHARAIHSYHYPWWEWR